VATIVSLCVGIPVIIKRIFLFFFSFISFPKVVIAVCATVLARARRPLALGVAVATPLSATAETTSQRVKQSGVAIDAVVGGRRGDIADGIGQTDELIGNLHQSARLDGVAIVVSFSSMSPFAALEGQNEFRIVIQDVFQQTRNLLGEDGLRVVRSAQLLLEALDARRTRALARRVAHLFATAAGLPLGLDLFPCGDGEQHVGESSVSHLALPEIKTHVLFVALACTEEIHNILVFTNTNFDRHHFFSASMDAEGANDERKS
jgi:hypothetical protein